MLLVGGHAYVDAHVSLGSAGPHLKGFLCDWIAAQTSMTDRARLARKVSDAWWPTFRSA